MKKTFSVKQRLIAAFLILLMIATAFVGTTFAWFTDSVTSAGNTIISGNLKVDLLHKVNNDWVSVKENLDHKIFDYDKWEPGYTRVETLKIQNLGSLALKYRLSIETDKANEKRGKGGESLSDVIEVYLSYGESADTSFESIKGNSAWSYKGTLTEVMNNPSSFLAGELLPTGKTLDANAADTTKVGFETVSIALHMKENAGNEYQDLRVGDIYVNLIATQWGSESDSFGPDYDKDALFPNLNISGITVDVTTANGIVTEAANVAGAGVAATIPAGVKVENGANKLGLSVTEKTQSDANISLNDGEALRSLDVHMSGVAKDNTVPMIITIEQAMKVGLNIGNYTLYHVENGASVGMTAVSSMAELDAHNEFYYDPATGNVTLAMATFSEVAMVAESSKWEGNRDYSWYDATKTEFVIANADQLAALSAIVGGMDHQTQDSFEGKTIKLIADINLGDNESANNPDIIFYPIGYWNNEGTYEKRPVEERVTAVSSGFYTFNGTFDGNGHTISNIYQNTWEMKGDHNWYDAIKEQYYRDGMGLFGRVYGGTVKNLTVKNFSSDGEITTTGVIAAYADFGATFENIAIFDCNPRVYNIGNGGIVGCVGWYTKHETDKKVTFTNITVDNSNKISALWGSYDVACGGIVGQYYPKSGQSSANYPVNAGIHFENCHVSAQMDVYNDVCANYQYYAYRYTGMLIGSVRENVTIDGHVYPKMDKITADGCTVHFGDWNDYYYCEIVANSLASYTHDHQFSRLEQVASVDVENKKVITLKGETVDIPASGWAHYVVVKSKDDDGKWVHGDGTDYATCYHFNNRTVWNHSDAGTEIVGGVEVLKEDKQLVYLEFNNLVTGYGWGVTSRGFKNLDGVTNLDISKGHENSVEKFKGEVTELVNNKTFKLGDIFTFVDNGVELVPGALSVAVTNLDENNPVSATIVYDRENWENSTMTFTGKGKITITIQDYYFCTPTTIEVTIAEREPEEKFDVVMNNGDFLHRVGNSGTVALDKLFEAKDGVTVGTISVTVEAVDGTVASGTYSNNAIQFNGTGVVKVTITDNDYCIPTELTLEVVDAVNATTATSATKNNVVMLNDAGFSSLEVSGGYALYGNGFTLTCGSDSAALDMGYAFVTLNNGTLDNVQIVCPNFDYAVLYKSNMTEAGNRSETTDRTRYFNVKSGVMVSGNSQILNSRISGARAAVNVTGGNCLIDNSRIELGAVASLLVGSANSVTLRDVTLVQKPTASTYDSSKTLMGFSVLMICNSEGNAAPLTIEGTLVQNAWVDENDKQYVPSAGQSIISTVLGKTEYLHDLDGDGTKESLNLGFAYMPESLTSKVNTTTITDNRTNKDVIPYDYADVSISKGKTYVYSYKNNNGTVDTFKNESEYVPNKYSDIITVNYSDVAEGLTAGKSFSTNGWVYELNVDLDKLSGYALDFSKLTMVVNGVTVTDFKVNGNAKPTSPVAVIAGGVTYTLTATVDGKEYIATFKVTGTETSKESPSKISGPTTAGFGVAKSYGGDWSGAADVLTGVKVKYWSVAENKYLEFDFSNFTVPGNAGKLNGTNNYWEYTHTNNDFTLKITNTVAIHSGKSVFGMPIRGTDGKLYFTISSTNGYVGSGTTSRAITMQYEFTDNNGGEKLTFTHTFNISYNKDEQYSYSDLSGSGKLTKLEASGGGGGGCVTGDTLVTLADGSKKIIRDLTSSDMLLVWDFYTGEYKVVPAALIINHGEDEWDVISMIFEDGTIVNAVSAHAFFNADINEFVMIDPQNVGDYIGQSFIKCADGEYTAVKLVDYTVNKKYTDSYSLVSTYYYNFIVEDMLSMTNLVPDLIAGLEIGEGMKYDEAVIAADIEKYGLYTYDDFKDYITVEQFNAFSGQYLKISVGKGYITYEGIIELICTFVNPNN